MKKTYETKRLYLKTIDETDQPFIYNHFSNPIVNKYLFDAEPLTKEEEALDIIHYYLHTKPKHQERFIMILKDSLQPIGTLGYHAVNMKDETIDIGYDLDPHYSHLGYMREALTFLIDFINHTYKGYDIHACIYKDNLRSIHAVKHFGFVYAKDTYEHFRGKDYLHHIYSLKR